MALEILDWLLVWTKEFFGSYGLAGLFLLAIIESIFFPIPVEVLLITLVLLEPQNWWLLGIVAGVGSVLGAMVAYWIGYTGKQVVLERFIPQKYLVRAHSLLQRYEALAVFIAAFTPIPYKVFAIIAGVLYIRFWPFVFISLLARTLRFLLVAIVTVYFSQQTMIINLVTLVVVLFVLELYIAKKIWFNEPYQ